MSLKQSSRLLAAAVSCPHLTASSTQPRSFEEIPGPPSRFWTENRDISKEFEHLLRLFEKYGPIVRVKRPFQQPVVHVFDPALAEHVFRTEGKNPHIIPLQETTQKYRQMRGMNPGLGNLNGEEWYRLRSSVQQSLMRPNAIEKYLPFVEKTAQDLVDHIASQRDGEGEVDMKKIAGRWSLESAGRTVFETRLGALGPRQQWADRLVEVNWEIFKLSAKMKFGFPWFRFFTTPNWKQMVRLEDEFYGEADRLMDTALKDLRQVGEKMLVSELIAKETLNSQDLKVIMLSLFADGLSTTAPMLIYNLYFLAKHPEAQEEIRKEVEAAGEGELTTAKRNKMPFLRAFIKETFRMCPIGTDISRVPQQEITLTGYRIPAGTAVDINTNILCRSEKLYPRATEFDPTRWLRENKAASEVHPFAFIPFGFGPRMCAGRRFAEQDLQVVLSRLVQNYRILHQYGPISQTYETLLLPKGDCRFKLDPRV